MTKKILDDRRTTGIHTTHISDDNGGRLNLITATAKRAKVIAGAIITVLSLFGTVMAAVVFGVNTQVHTQIEAETHDENGVIRMEIENCIKEELEEELAVIEDEIDRIGDVGEELAVKQEAMSNQIERNHDEIMRMLRNGDSS